MASKATSLTRQLSNSAGYQNNTPPTPKSKQETAEAYDVVAGRISQFGTKLNNNLLQSPFVNGEELFTQVKDNGPSKLPYLVVLNHGRKGDQTSPFILAKIIRIDSNGKIIRISHFVQ